MTEPGRHSAGCLYGGFSCGYWLIADGCDEFHPETHYVTDDRCPCGTEFPGAGTGVFVSDANDKELPAELQDGLGTAVLRPEGAA